jgi:hypothetical protein
MAGLAQHTKSKLRAGLGVSGGGCNAEQIDLSALKCKCEGKCIIDIVADVGIDDDLVACRTGRRRLAVCSLDQAAKQHCEAMNSSYPVHLLHHFPAPPLFGEPLRWENALFRE